jgi:hypothetical protein
VNENSDEGDGAISAERIPFEIQIECTRRRDRGKKSLEFRHRRDESRGRCRSGYVERMAMLE